MTKFPALVITEGYFSKYITENTFITRERWGKLSQLTSNEGCQTGRHSFGCLKAVKIGLTLTTPVMQRHVGESCRLMQQVLLFPMVTAFKNVGENGVIYIGHNAVPICLELFWGTFHPEGYLCICVSRIYWSSFGPGRYQSCKDRSNIKYL